VDDNLIWCARVSCWITKAINTPISSSNVQSNTTCLTNIFIDLGLHVSIHYGIIIRASLKIHRSIREGMMMIP